MDINHRSRTCPVLAATDFGVTGMLLAWMVKVNFLSSLDSMSWPGMETPQDELLHHIGHCPPHRQGKWHLVK